MDRIMMQVDPSSYTNILKKGLFLCELTDRKNIVS